MYCIISWCSHTNWTNRYIFLMVLKTYS